MRSGSRMQFPCEVHCYRPLGTMADNACVPKTPKPNKHTENRKCTDKIIINNNGRKKGKNEARASSEGKVQSKRR